MEENIPLPQKLTSCLKQNMYHDDDQVVASITGEDNIAQIRDQMLTRVSRADQIMII